MALAHKPIPINDLIRGKLVLLALPTKKAHPDSLLSAGAADVLVLKRKYPDQAVRVGNHAEKAYRRISCVRKNNCNIAILHGTSAFALMEKREFANFSHILVHDGLLRFCVALGLLLYGKRGILEKIGRTAIDWGGYVDYYHVLRSNYTSHNSTRQYAPTGLNPLEILRQFNDLNYVLLNNSTQVAEGTHCGDLDLLVAQSDLAEIKRRIHRQVGTYPMDIYTDDGQSGHGYKSVPYFSLPLSKALLNWPETNAAGIRVPSVPMRYTALCYHLIFHGKCSSSCNSSGILDRASFTKPKYYQELLDAAKAAGRPAPKSFDELETHLKAEGVMPSLDLIGFYSNKNEFLKARYFSSNSKRPGLATFFIRDFGQGSKLIAPLRDRLIENFEILAEGAVDETNRTRIMEGVRGGNWIDDTAPGNIAMPVYWFVCWDPNPVKPSTRTRRKHPRVDNENIRLKDELRRNFGGGSTHKNLRIIHSSDNTMEAVDHIHFLGLDAHPAIAPYLTELKSPAS